MRVTAPLLLALSLLNAASASLMPLQARSALERISGGADEKASARLTTRFLRWPKDPKPGKGPKIFPKLTGDGVDVVCGAVWGGATGAVLGSLIDGALSAAKYGAFTGVVIMAGQVCHWRVSPM